jgi:putative transposase
VRHRSRQTKGYGNRTATLTMVYKLAKMAEKGWIKLRSFALLQKIVAGIKFKDGEEVKEQVA